ncbi:sensor histidine kinase [Chondromyces apiculatus]|uniref:histidine kinase n=1 Tax=Chondromyces apiculatus DSM 436 TaxID=1192034 RepID=A0A017TJ93_9BACT|nr:GAF domain-containing protein [Chondromyces apiculatus]EYF08910.1 Hypothetical protein CAP_2771 [Chondromyces apiculatus DSM 436]
MLLRALRYGFAVVAAALSVGLTGLASRKLGLDHGYFMIPLAAVMMVSLFAGLRPALITAVLSGLATAILVVPPQFSAVLRSGGDGTVLLLYGGLATGMAHLGAFVHDFYARVQTARVDADQALVKLRHLQSITETALEDRPLPELLHELLSRVADIFLVDTALVLLLDEDRETLVVSAAYGVPEATCRAIRIPRGEGLAGRVFASRRTLRTDVREAAFGPGTEGTPESRYAVGVPLLVDGRVLGVLDLGTREERRFSDEDVTLLELTAGRIARAVERVQLHETLAERAAQQAAIAALGQRAIAGEPVDGLLKAAAATVATELRADIAVVLELSANGEHLDVRALVGPEGTELPISQSPETLVGDTLRSRVPLVIADVRTDPRFPRVSSVLIALHIVSAISVAVEGPTQPFGVLGVYACHKRLFTEDDVHFLEAVANVISEAVRNQHAIAVAMDAERQMERLYADAMEAVRVREEFLTIASHELRTPLTPLALQIGSLQRALRADPSRLSHERLLGKVEIVARQVARLHRLVSDLLDLSLLTAGNISLHREEVDLAAAARDAAHRFQEPASRAGCALRLSADKPVKGWGDRTRIDQIFTQLLSNAIKYGAGAPIDLRVESDDDVARIVVRDRGIGIPPDQQARIFGRFERAVSEQHYGGFGLGLWIVKQLLDALGGSISVESAPGQGSTFTVELPRREAATDSGSTDTTSPTGPADTTSPTGPADTTSPSPSDTTSIAGAAAA